MLILILNRITNLFLKGQIFCLRARNAIVIRHIARLNAEKAEIRQKFIDAGRAHELIEIERRIA